MNMDFVERSNHGSGTWLMMSGETGGASEGYRESQGWTARLWPSNVCRPEALQVGRFHAPKAQDSIALRNALGLN